MHHDYFLPLHQRTLIWQFVRREVLTRYRGSLLGLGWAFLTPLLMLSVYTLVFRGIFKARWSGGATGNFEFALQVYAGLIVFSLFAEVTTRAPRLVLDEPNLVKKVVFPLEILPWVAVLAGLIHLALNLAALLAVAAIARGGLPLSVLALPLVILRVAEPPVDARRAAAARLGGLAVVETLRSPEMPLYLMSFAGTFGGSSMFSMLGYYAMDRAGGSPSHVGLMFTALGLGAVVTQALLVGRVTRRWGEPAGIRIGFLVGAVGFLAVALAGQPATITAAVGLTSVAMALIRPSLAALNSRLTTTGYGTSLGMQTSFDSLGRTLGPLWAGTIYHAAMAGPFLAAAGVYLLAGIAALRLTVPTSGRTPPR